MLSSHYPAQFISSIMLHRNYSARSLRATEAKKIMIRKEEVRRCKQMCMLLVAFIMQYVSSLMTYAAHLVETCTDVL